MVLKQESERRLGASAVFWQTFAIAEREQSEGLMTDAAVLGFESRNSH